MLVTTSFISLKLGQEKHSKNITNIFKKTFGYLLKFCTQCETYGLKQGLQTELKEPLGKSKEGSS